jgi:hypothetical protein
MLFYESLGPVKRVAGDATTSTPPADLTTFHAELAQQVLAHVYTYAADSGRIATVLFPGESAALGRALAARPGSRSSVRTRVAPRSSSTVRRYR